MLGALASPTGRDEQGSLVWWDNRGAYIALRVSSSSFPFKNRPQASELTDLKGRDRLNLLDLFINDKEVLRQVFDAMFTTLPQKKKEGEEEKEEEGEESVAKELADYMGSTISPEELEAV